MAFCILLLLNFLFFIPGHKWRAVEWLHGLSIRPFHNYHCHIWKQLRGKTACSDRENHSIKQNPKKKGNKQFLLLLRSALPLSIIPPQEYKNVIPNPMCIYWGLILICTPETISYNTSNKIDIYCKQNVWE